MVGSRIIAAGPYSLVDSHTHPAAFLPLVPHTKHLHLILSPLTLFLKREGFSQIPPLSGDEDFGIVTGKDITQITALQAYSCVECGRCTEHCPANNTGKELNRNSSPLCPRLSQRIRPTIDTPLLQAAISQSAVFQCTTCGACEYQCPVGIQHLPIIISLRRGAVNTGGWKTITAPNFSSTWSAMAMPWASPNRSAISSLPNNSCQFLMVHRNTVYGSAAWAPTIRTAANHRCLRLVMQYLAPLSEYSKKSAAPEILPPTGQRPHLRPAC